MTEDTERPGPGRPRDLEKRAAILDAARDLFFEHGVEAVAIEAIAAMAEVSKVTIYNQFGDKIGLFEEVVRREAGLVAQTVAALAPGGTSLEACLNAWGGSLMQFLLRKNITAFDRLLSAEAHRHPALARRFFEAGPGRMRQAVADVIAKASAKGEIEVDDPIAAAEDLCMLWQGFLPMEARLGLRTICLSDVERRVERGTAIFLRAACPRRRRPADSS